MRIRKDHDDNLYIISRPQGFTKAEKEKYSKRYERLNKRDVDTKGVLCQRKDEDTGYSDNFWVYSPRLSAQENFQEVRDDIKNLSWLPYDLIADDVKHDSFFGKALGHLFSNIMMGIPGIFMLAGDIASILKNTADGIVHSINSIGYDFPVDVTDAEYVIRNRFEETTEVKSGSDALAEL